MDGMTTWLFGNWETVLVISYGLDKLVKITPTKYDDLLVDLVFGTIKKMMGKGQ